MRINTGESDNFSRHVSRDMNTDQIIAIFFVLLMVGSGIAMGASIL
jgi:hypothetical protein